MSFDALIMADEPTNSGLAPNEDRAWTRRLRNFSGKPTCSNGELDFDAWKFQVEQLTSQGDISEAIQRRLILQSLVQPALGLVRSIGTTSSIEQILGVIDVVYGPSADGHSLLLKFHDSVQHADETATVYLQRLQRLLRRVVDSDELSTNSEYTYLLRQFCRGCHDEGIILTLCLESSPDRYDDFCELLMAIHNEESRRRDKAARLGRGDASKNRVKASARSGQCDLAPSPPEVTQRAAAADGGDLETVLAKVLSHQTEAIVCGLKALNANSPNEARQQAQCSLPLGTQANDRGWQVGGEGQTGRGGRRQQQWPIFCYRCGLENHKFKECPNHSNAALVQERLQSRFQNSESAQPAGRPQKRGATKQKSN